MKTIAAIRMDIAYYEKEMESCARSGEFNKGKKWVNLRTMALKAIQFVELGSGEQYLIDQLSDVQEQYNRVYYNNPHLDHKGNPYKKQLHDKYENVNGIPGMREKISFLKYILEKQ